MFPPALFDTASGHRPTWTQTGSKSVTLPSGKTVDLPVQYQRWAAAGALFPASLDSLRSILPDQLTPIPINHRAGLVGLASIDYQSVANIDPYHEFAVMIPAHETENRVGISNKTKGGFMSSIRTGMRAFLRGDDPLSWAGNYVQYMPVTTEDAYHLGIKEWGFMKEVVDISISEDGRTRCTTVSLNGDRIITLQSRLPSWGNLYRSGSYQTYAQKNGTLIRGTIQFNGEIGVRPLDPRASYTLGEHPRADIIRDLDVGAQPVAQLYAGNMHGQLHSAEELR